MTHEDLARDLNLSQIEYTLNMARYYEAQALASETRLSHATTKLSARYFNQDIAMYRALAHDYYDEALKLGCEQWIPIYIDK